MSSKCIGFIDVIALETISGLLCLGTTALNLLGPGIELMPSRGLLVWTLV